MAKDRVEPCLHYVSEGNTCKKGRIGEHRSYCQRCQKYEPRVKKHHLNKKKQELDKIQRKEFEA